MAYISTSTIGNGTGAYQTDIVVKDLDLDVSNRVKDDTPVWTEKFSTLTQ